MAVLLTLLSIAAGAGLGLAKGGRIDRVFDWRPRVWPALAVGLALQLLLRVTGWTGGWALAVELVSSACLLTFAAANIRVGGMVLVVAGLALNLAPTILDGGMPTSRSALVTAGVIAKDTTGSVKIEGARHVATDADSLTWLGENIPIPTGQVISFGDLVLHLGYFFVAAALVRGRILPDDHPANYRRRIAPLGAGPAQRRGPGLHPSRLDPKVAARERRRREDPGGDAGSASDRSPSGRPRDQ